MKSRVVILFRQNDIQVEKQWKNWKKWIFIKFPGGRVHLAEQEEKREQLSNHKELLHAAANLDKQQEVLDDAGTEKAYNANGAEDSGIKDIEVKNRKNKGEKSVNRPLVDG